MRTATACLLAADHYTGITDNWNQGLIHCSPVTAKLVIHLLGVKPEYVKPLAMDQEHHIQGAGTQLSDTIAISFVWFSTWITREPG